MVAWIRYDSESDEVRGYDPIKGFRSIDKAKHYAYKLLNDLIAIARPTPEAVEYTEAVDDDVWNLSYTHLWERIVNWQAPHLPPVKEKRRISASPLYAVLTIEVDDA